MKTNSLWLGAGVVAGCLLLTAQTPSAWGFEQNLDRTFPAEPGGKLVIHADRGAIKVTTDAADKVQIHVVQEVKDGTKAQADELFANHEVTFSQAGKTVTVTAQNKHNKLFSWGRGPWLQVRYELSIPAKFDVDLRTAGGDIDVGTLDGTAAAHTSSGSIRLPSVTGSVEVKDAGGNISLGEVGGDVTAHTSSGSITVKTGGRDVEVWDAGGNIRVDEAGRDVTARTSSGSITLGHIKRAVKASDAGGNIHLDAADGEVEAQTTSGSIQIGQVKGKSLRVKDAGGNIAIAEAAGDVWAETSSGSIQVQAASGKVEARDSGGNISIGEAAGPVIAETTSGSITVKKAGGPLEAKDAGGSINVGEAGGEATVRTSSGSIAIGKAAGPVTAHDAGGNIRVTEAHDVVTAETTSGSVDVGFAAAPRGECRLSVAGGGVKVTLPSNAAVDLDAKAAGGSVTSDLPVTMVVHGARASGELAGKINGGGPALVLRASSGNIQIKGSTTAAVEEEK